MFPPGSVVTVTSWLVQFCPGIWGVWGSGGCLIVTFPDNLKWPTPQWKATGGPHLPPLRLKEQNLRVKKGQWYYNNFLWVVVVNVMFFTCTMLRFFSGWYCCHTVGWCVGWLLSGEGCPVPVGGMVEGLCFPLLHFSVCCVSSALSILKTVTKSPNSLYVKIYLRIKNAT